MAFVWTKDLETGNALIDNEHRQLVKAADELVEACGQGKGRQEVGKAVEFLSNYTKTHFAHEEELQLKYKYPDYAAHKSWHQSFLKEFEDVAAKLKAEGATIALVADVNAKVSKLITHIKTLDLKLAQYIQSSQSK
ncbi:MAG: hemerythrin family protein [Clostridiales bacterium]|jgi:hemerythrin|nr:hemerythrin family protein [Clostridiales bacterium]